MRPLSLSLVVALSMLLANSLLGEEAPLRIDPRGARCELVINPSDDLIPDQNRYFLRRARGKNTKIVAIKIGDANSLKVPALEVDSVTELAVSGLEKLEETSALDTLRDATGIWVSASAKTPLPQLAADSKLAALLESKLASDCVISVSGSAAPWLIEQFSPPTRPSLVPHVQFAFVRSYKELSDVEIPKRDAQKLLQFVFQPTTVLAISQRSIVNLGGEPLAIFSSGFPGENDRTTMLQPGKQHDLVALARAAQRRQRGEKLLAQLATPEVKHGSLVIVGGGGMPKEITEKFIELAGGPDGLIVVLPTAVPPQEVSPSEGNFFKRFGAKNVRVMPEYELEDVNSDKFAEVLCEAKGVWFGGGRQWRFVDTYENTRAYELFHAVLERGGVIGGSSAGATIQGEYLSRGSPLGNFEMMSEGYEEGFKFLPGTVIDQHFAERKRETDLLGVIKTFPQLTGIGLDEATAIAVTKREAEVLGKGAFHLLAAPKDREVTLDDYQRFKAGDVVDLVERKLVRTSRTEEPAAETSSGDAKKEPAAAN